MFKQNMPPPEARQTFVVGWTGMRGVVALAAALSLPMTIANGAPFPQRNVILFLTFAVIFVTLVIQGLTLAPLIRALGLVGKAGPNCEERTAQQLMIEAVLAHLANARERDDAGPGEVYDDLTLHYRNELAALTGSDGDGDKAGAANQQQYLALGHELLQIERRTLIGLRNQGRINDEVLRRLERKLDLGEEELLASAD